MKLVCLLFLTLFFPSLLYAQTPQDGSTIKTKKKIDTSVYSIPEFPGGLPAFGAYLGANLQYPYVARLIGINGKLSVQFAVDTDGRITDVTPKNCIGAGCEAEAVKLLESSPAWKPGIQKGMLVKVHYTVPINFSLGKNDGKIYLTNLQQSNYGFIFSIKGSLYTLDEAKKTLGESFMSDQIEIAVPFYNYNKVAKFDIPDKKEVYLIILKAS